MGLDLRDDVSSRPALRANCITHRDECEDHMEDIQYREYAVHIC